MMVKAALESQNSSASISNKALGISADDFLKLLVAQIQNQDPLKPMDDTAFIAQTAQFSQLEEARNASQWLETIASTQNSGRAVSFAHLLGRHVRALSDGFYLEGEVSSVIADNGYVRLVVGGIWVDPGDVFEIVLEEQS